MALIVTRDPEAFAIFYDRHGASAYSLALRMVGGPAAAEDVTQETFISIWRFSAGFDVTRGSARSWLLGIVRNRSIDLLRSGASRTKLDLDDEAIIAQRASEDRTEEEALRLETATEIRSALGALPGEQSRAIELAYFAGLSQVEISELLHVPLGTVKGRIRLGLEKIRLEIGGQLQ